MTKNQTESRKVTHDRDMKCPYCQRRFQTPDDLTLHIVTRHTHVGISRGPAQAGGK